MAPEQTEAATDATLTPPETEVAPEAPEPATDPAGGNAEPDVEALQMRLRELEAEKAERERTDALAAVVRRFHYISEEIVQALPEDLSADRVEAVAAAINQAMHAAMNPPAIGRGGLTPSEERRATWDGLFRSTL
ncbi:hypothetical protein ACIQU6_24440 [Streptomyces sp. NPDC090442]|uniref:hypothetical protein n=1 Tax=Streptomyces sp. NPDC090442 TaxID=3365962 RepID=UPI0037F24CC1